MLKRIANLLEDNSIYFAIILTIVITFLSLQTVKIPKSTFGYFDKVAHVSAYSALSLSWFLSFCLSENKNRNLLLIGIAISIYGIIIEFIQGNYTTNREADIYDVLANTFGLLIGFGIFHFWKQKRKRLNKL
jgi:VanZ family protein